MNLKSVKSYRVVKFLLTRRVTSQTEIAEETSAAVGYVNEVLHELESLNIVSIEYGKTTLLDYAKLLDKISYDRSFKKLITKTIRLPTSTIKETEKKLQNYCENNNVKYAFSGFSALKYFYEYHINYPIVHIYLENTDYLNSLEKGEGTIPVEILNPDRSDIFLNSTPLNNTNLCEKMQVIIDLYSSGLGRDAAIKFYRDIIWQA